MKPRKLAPVPKMYTDARLPFNERVKKALDKLRKAGRGDSVDLSDLSPGERDFALKLAHLPEDVDLSAYCEAWVRHRQQFVMPQVRHYVSDLAVMISQPEILHCLLGRWVSPRKSTGPKAAYAGSKAAMLVMAALGIGPHVDDNVAYLADNGSAKEVCAAALEEAAEMSGNDPEPFRIGSVDRVLRHFRELSPTLGRLAMEANVQMLRSLAVLHPGRPICHAGGIDGTAFAAWCPQRGSGGDPDKEARLRGRAEHAGFRYHGYDGGKHDVAEGEKVDARRTKFWRGYHLVALVDYCTGRPIVWTLVDAKLDEAKTLHELLRVLYELWPDCPLKTIVGDGAWDNKASHELCEAGYGVHLVAARTSDTKVLNAKHDLKPWESDLIDHFDGRGVAYCRAHGAPLSLRGNGFPKRDGLAPGEAAPEAQFRLRFACEHGCGNPSLQMRRHWTALAYYPHHGHGQPRRYAERYALLAHRNVCESFFNALKVGHGIATAGADRLRLTDFDSVHALVDLSFCMGTALMLGNERSKVGVTWLPRDPEGDPPMEEGPREFAAMQEQRAA